MSTSRHSAAWVTLLTRDSYLAGVRVLWRSLRQAGGTRYPMVVMVTDDVSAAARATLTGDGCRLVEVDRVDPPPGASYIFERFSEVWSKLQAWRLDYDRVVLLDADMLVVEPMDDAMTMPLPDGGIAACHTCRCNPEHHPAYPTDWVPARCWFSYWSGRRPLPADFDLYFNAGVIVLRPDPAVFDDLVAQIAHLDLRDYPFPEQDLLNEYFRWRWSPLPFGYNALKTFTVQHPDVWATGPVRNIHYVLGKPWDDEPATRPEYAALDQRWRAVAAELDQPSG